MKKLYKLRFIPMIIFAIFTGVNFVELSAASLPYQDATAEMLQKQSQQMSVLENLLIISCLLLGASVIYIIVITKLSKRQYPNL